MRHRGGRAGFIMPREHGPIRGRKPSGPLGRWLGCLLVVLLALSAAPSSAAAAPYAAIVIDAATGEVVHARSADEPRFPASLTKIMTLYLVFEAVQTGRLSWSETLPVSRHAASMPPSRLGLRPGERIRLDDAVMALVTKSANDAAVVVAEAVGGTESEFAELMTRRAGALGMTSTRFRNASGLPNKAQVTTARDMARLGRAMIRDFPREYGLFATRSFDYRGRTLRNHNALLGKVVGVDGIKTGYIRASGYNLVASAERDGRRVVGVVIGGRSGKSRDAKMVELLEAAFKRLPDVLLVGPPLLNPLRSAERGGLEVASLPDPGPALHAGRVEPGPAAPVPVGKPAFALDLYPRAKPDRPTIPLSTVVEMLAARGGLPERQPAAPPLTVDDILDLR